MQQTRTTVFITDRFTALHRWAAAPAIVWFLSVPHRHVFHVRCELRVTHSDRDIEFFMAKQKLHEILQAWDSDTYKDVHEMSCEMFAHVILQQMRGFFPTCFRVEVSEDGENGSVVEIPNEPVNYNTTIGDSNVG
jgi:hypothetical protein